MLLVLLEERLDGIDLVAQPLIAKVEIGLERAGRHLEALGRLGGQPIAALGRHLVRDALDGRLEHGSLGVEASLERRGLCRQLGDLRPVLAVPTRAS